MNNSVSKDQIKTIIRESMQDYYCERGISSPTTIDIGHAFARFYINEIFANKYNITDEEINDGLNIDGKGDLGADCIFIKDNTYMIFQFKYKGQKNCITKDEIAGFKELYEKFSNQEHVSAYGNSEIKAALSKFSAKSNAIFYFVTNDELRDDYKDVAVKRDNIEYQYIDLNEIWIEYKNVVSQSNGVPELVTLPIQKIENDTNACIDLTSLVAKNSGYETMILVLKGSQIKELYEHKNYRDSLFTYNIRGYLGEKPVNRKIRDTIIEQPENFYYLNNGISAICTSYKVINNSEHSTFIECENFQIINGAQTVTTIAKTPKEHLKNLDFVQVIMRLTKTEDIKSHKKGLNRDIIQANNNQTAIKISDFRSNDEIQLFLENELNNFMYKGTNPFLKIKYQPKRKYFKKNKSDNLFIIQMDTLAKVLYSFYYDPIKFQSKPALLYDVDTENEGLYWKIFGINDEEASLYDKSKLSEIAAIIIMWIHLQEKSKIVKKIESQDSRLYQATLAKWQIMYALGLVMRTLTLDEGKKVINHLVDGKYLVSNGVLDNWMNIILEIIEDLLDDEYETNQEDQNAFNLRNWLRKKDLTNKIEKRIERKKDKFNLTIAST